MIRKAKASDLCRIAEIYVFNNRINYLPIFGDIQYSFGQLQVDSVRQRYFGRSEILEALYVYEEDGLILGFTELHGREVEKLYVDSFFQSRGIGAGLLDFAVNIMGVNFLWALEKNTRALEFYHRHGFFENGERKHEEATQEFIVKLVKN